MPELRRGGAGSIVNVTSIYGTVGGNGSASAHEASKRVVRMMTKSAAVLYAKEQIRVNSVHPAFIDTPIVAPFLKGKERVALQVQAHIESMTPTGRVGRAGEVALRHRLSRE